MKKIILIIVTLLMGLTAQAMLTEVVSFNGQKRSNGNTSYFSWQIQSYSWGEASLPMRQGSSYTFDNTNLNWSLDLHLYRGGWGSVL